jgi:glycosyltransferase involved in cell wall biosynthesis
LIDDPPLVAVSNNGGGISRHLELTNRAVALSPVELPESIGLSTKVRRLRAILRADGASSVVTHGVAAGLSARLRGRRLRDVRHVEFWHGDPFFGSPLRRAAYRALAAAGRPPRVQVFTHEWLAAMYAESSSEIVVLPNAVPVRRPAPVWRQREGRVAVFLGRFSPEKGLGDLLHAWPPESATRGWRLVAYGEGQGPRGTLPVGVTVAGHTTSPLEVLAESDLVVIPSWTETGPYVALESLSVGRPFVGTRVGDMPAIVGQAGCGWLCDPRDPHSLRGALDRAQVASDEERVLAGARGVAWLDEHRPYDAWLRRVEEVYA